LTGSPINGERAYHIGLFSEVLADREALFVSANTVADEIIEWARWPSKRSKTSCVVPTFPSRAAEVRRVVPERCLGQRGREGRAESIRPETQTIWKMR